MAISILIKRLRKAQEERREQLYQEAKAKSEARGSRILAPPPTFQQFVTKNYGKEGYKDFNKYQFKDQLKIMGDYTDVLENQVPYIKSTEKPPTNFYQGFSQSFLPTGYFQNVAGNRRRRYKTGGLVIAEEEANSNRSRGARKELKGTKFKGVF
tara:strand:- start:573 stop:1034 length:462 start_codon:yes stop_codon:yes gene_type:complete